MITESNDDQRGERRERKEKGDQHHHKQNQEHSIASQLRAKPSVHLVSQHYCGLLISSITMKTVQTESKPDMVIRNPHSLRKCRITPQIRVNTAFAKILIKKVL